MNEPASVFVALQDAVVARLTGDAFFTPPAPGVAIEPLTERIGDIVQKIKTALSKLGLSVVVLTPVARMPEPGVSALTFSVPVIVQISELVIVNQGSLGTKKSALAAVERTMRLLHHFPHGVTPGSPRVCRFELTETPFTLVEQEPFSLITSI